MVKDMKFKIFLCVLGLGISSAMAGSVDSYVQSVEQSNQKYQKQLRHFLKSLDSQQSRFNEKQQEKFCDLVQKHIDEIYTAVENNQDIFSITKQYNKQRVIDEVQGQREFKTLTKYGVSCQFK